MRKILYAMKEIRKNQLSDQGASSARLQEAEDKFAFLDRELSGISTFGANERMQEVMISADFTYAIQEFVQRKMWASYSQQTFAFEPLVKNDTLPNYLPVTRYLDQAGVDDLEYIGEKAPPRPGYVSDATKRQWQVYVWAKQFDFSHQALINDDLGYFDNVTDKMGRAARRTLEKFVSRMYTNATSIARLTGLGALYWTTGRLTTARISAARMAFNQRLDIRGERINADLRYIVYHTGLADTVAQIQASELVPELATNAANTIRGSFVGIKDPYIVGTAPTLPWYAFTDPNVGPAALVLARRAGVAGPMILRKRSDVESVTSILGAGTAVDPVWGDFDTMNIVLKVVDVWGTYIDGTEGNLVDYRGAYGSAATAP